MTVKRLAFQCEHLFAYVTAVVIEQIDEALQNVEVECRGNQFSVGSPFVTCKELNIYESRRYYWLRRLEGSSVLVELCLAMALSFRPANIPMQTILYH